MRAENLHLTFAFIGPLEEDTARRVALACKALAVEPFDWQVDAIGFFARPRVLWAGGPLSPALEALATSVRSMLDGLQVKYDRKPFVPHVTLLRDVKSFDGEASVFPPLPWRIEDVALFRSTQDEHGARYLRVEQ
jgi:2'-5' RNA ligase